MEEKSHPILQVFLLVAAGLLVGVWYKYDTPVVVLALTGTVVAAIATSFAYWINPCQEKCPPCPPCPPHDSTESRFQAALAEIDSEQQDDEWASCQSNFHVASPSVTSVTCTVLPKRMPSPCTVPPVTATPAKVQTDVCSDSVLLTPCTPEPVKVSAVILFRRMCTIEFLHLESEFWCLADSQNQEKDLSAKESALKFVLEAAKLNPKSVVLHPEFSKTVTFKTGEKVTKVVTYFAAEVSPCAKVKVSHKWLSVKESLRASKKNCSQLLGVLSDIASLKSEPAFKPLCVRKRPEPWFAQKKEHTLGKMVKRADRLVLNDARFKRKWAIDNTKIDPKEQDCFCPQMKSKRISKWVWVLTFGVLLVVVIASAAVLLYFFSPEWLKINK